MNPKLFKRGEIGVKAVRLTPTNQHEVFQWMAGHNAGCVLTPRDVPSDWPQDALLQLNLGSVTMIGRGGAWVVQEGPTEFIILPHHLFTLIYKEVH